MISLSYKRASWDLRKIEQWALVWPCSPLFLLVSHLPLAVLYFTIASHLLSPPVAGPPATSHHTPFLPCLAKEGKKIHYHPGKANVVADAFSRKSMKNLAILITHQSQLLKDIRKLKLDIRVYDSTVRLANMRVQPTLIERIIVAQNGDP